MTKRENLLALIKKQPYKEVPVDFGLSPGLEKVYRRRTGSELHYLDYFGMPWRSAPDPVPVTGGKGFKKYYPDGLKPGTTIDMWGVAHEPGSAAALHMTRMLHPLLDADSPAVLDEYPFPSFDGLDSEDMRGGVMKLHDRGLASVGYMQMTIWETAWAIRSMEELMMDMISEDPMAEKLLDIITGIAVRRAELYAGAGVDILYLGDDIGMQRTAMMSEEMYTFWLKPRLCKVIKAAREVNPGILVFYHSCGMVYPFIPHLIDAGIDVLNPVQPECMDFERIHKEFGENLSFCGTIGTQSTMPLGTPEDVRETVWRNLDIAQGGKGLFVTPTHLLEDDVPWENIIAYVDACRDYQM